MPATAPLEGLKAAQKEVVSISAMLYACLPVGRRFALCFTEMAPHRLEKRLQTLA